MRKIALLAIGVGAVVFGVVSVALAANTYSVTVAKVTPTKAGTPLNPKPTLVNFGFQVAESAGNRPAVTTDFVIGFGPKIKSGRKYFKGNKTCTVRQAGYVQGAAPLCPVTAKAGGGSIQNLAGVSTDPTSKIPCYLALTLYVGDGKAVPAASNDGFAGTNDVVLALKGGPNPDPAKNCPLGVDAAIPAKFTVVGGGAALAFHVKAIPFQHPSQGIDNSVINVTSSAGKAVSVRTRVGRRFRNVPHGLLESIGCVSRAHKVTVKFTAGGVSSTAFKNAPCIK